MEQKNINPARCGFIRHIPPRTDKDIDDLIFEGEIPKNCSDR